MDWTGGPPLGKSFNDRWLGLSPASRGIILMVVSTMGFSVMRFLLPYRTKLTLSTTPTANPESPLDY